MQTEFPPVTVPEGWLTVLAALQRQGVQYVVAASAAEQVVTGTGMPEGPLSIAPAPYRRNLERLTAALTGLGAALHGADGKPHPFDISRVVNHPAVHWNLLAGGTELYVLGSAVGDGEFSIRLWRTRPIILTADGQSVRAEVELATDRTPVSA